MADLGMYISWAFARRTLLLFGGKLIASMKEMSIPSWVALRTTSMSLERNKFSVFLEREEKFKEPLIQSSLNQESRWPALIFKVQRGTDAHV